MHKTNLQRERENIYIYIYIGPVLNISTNFAVAEGVVDTIGVGGPRTTSYVLMHICRYVYIYIIHIHYMRRYKYIIRNITSYIEYFI